MKKLLIATSAVVGLGVVSADFAAAQLETSFSGLIRVRLSKGAKATDAIASNKAATSTVDVTTGAIDQAVDDTAAVDNREQTATLSVNRTQLQWDAQGTTDSGLTYGGRMRFRPGADAAGRDQAYVYFGGGFGTVQLGNAAGVSGIAAGAVTAVAGAGGIDGGLGSRTTPNMLAAGTFRASMPAFYADTNGGAQNLVAYASPSFGGVQIHADYAFDVDGNANSGSGNTKGNENRMAIGLTYDGEFGDSSVGGAITYVKGRKEGTIDADGAVTPVDVNAAKHLMVGIHGGFGPASVGFTYLDSGKSGVNNILDDGDVSGGQKAMALSAAYSFGAGSVSLGYATSKAQVATDAAAGTKHSDKTSSVVLSAGYTMAPGWTVYGDIARHSTKTGGTVEDNASNSASSTSWVLGTNVSF